MSQDTVSADILPILLVDDDEDLASMLVDYLAPEGFDVHWVSSGEAALRQAEDDEFRLMVLDVMMPSMNGFEVLKRLRRTSDLPVLMLTARGEDVDRIVGLELGADDYLAKPFNPRELSARIRAILRRVHGGMEESETDGLKYGEIELRPASRRVFRAGEEVRLTGTEFEILSMLMVSAGEVVSRESLSRTVLGRRLMPFDRSIDTHISNLRGKLIGTDRLANPIRNVRGVGYVLVETD